MGAEATTGSDGWPVSCPPRMKPSANEHPTSRRQPIDEKRANSIGGLVAGTKKPRTTRAQFRAYWRFIRWIQSQVKR